MPMVPELPIAMLACARIGAPHSVVFGGFAPEALRDRIHDAESSILITADGGFRRGSTVALKKNADEALRECPDVNTVVVLKRTRQDIHMQAGRDVWWHDFVKDAPAYCAPEQMDSEDMLYMLYTSGTTGKPKGIVHTTGGYLTGVYATTKWVFDLKDDDVYWCTADIGWVTGHSYIVYGPLANGTTTVMYEGTPDYPDKDRFWRIVEKYGVTICYTAPTAIRTFMRWGEAVPEALRPLEPAAARHRSGEPINPEAWVWYWKVIGGGRCPVVDTWWQTETGQIMITPLPGITTLKPGSATRPVPRHRGRGGQRQGRARPRPATWCSRSPGRACSAASTATPSASRPSTGASTPASTSPATAPSVDEEGYFWLLGRVDDVMNVSGHRVSTMEVESALVDHPARGGGRGDRAPARDQGPGHRRVRDDQGRRPRPARSWSEELKAHVAKKIGALARPDDLIFTADLPKTRSRQDHAPPPAGHRRGQGARRHHHPGRPERGGRDQGEVRRGGVRLPRASDSLGVFAKCHGSDAMKTGGPSTATIYISTT